jgi:formate/nitrite transporter
MPDTLPPADVAKVFVAASIAKHRQRPEVTFLKAFNAGLYLSIGGLLSEIIAGGAGGINTSNPGIVKFFQGAAFPVGLIMIVLQGQELLTSNMLIMPMGVVKRALPWWSIPYNWLLVFFGNLVGSLFMAGILSKFTATVTVDPYKTFILEAAVKKAITPNFLQIFLRGIGCNLLVCLAVWQAAVASDVISKIVAVWIPIMVFVTLGYDHVVANMFSLPLSIMLGGELTIAEYIRKSLIAAFFGNIIGAQLVGLPFVFFYLRDWSPAAALEAAEAGMFDKNATSGSINGSNEATDIKEV